MSRPQESVKRFPHELDGQKHRALTDPGLKTVGIGDGSLRKLHSSDLRHLLPVSTLRAGQGECQTWAMEERPGSFDHPTISSSVADLTRNRSFERSHHLSLKFHSPYHLNRGLHVALG
jgi:hypothetical protein